jgi:hypothetical protein
MGAATVPMRAEEMEAGTAMGAGKAAEAVKATVPKEAAEEARAEAIQKLMSRLEAAKHRCRWCRYRLFQDSSQCLPECKCHMRPGSDAAA